MSPATETVRTPGKLADAELHFTNGALEGLKRMSAAARKAVSARMKRYWAERRKAQEKVK
jgi:hypothetical protein